MDTEEFQKSLEEDSREFCEKPKAHVGSVVSDALKEVVHEYRCGRNAVSSGLWSLDLFTEGLETGRLLLVSGCVGIGKTSFVLNLAHHIAGRGQKSVAIFSTSETRIQTARHLLTIEACVPLKDLWPGSLDDESWRRLSLAQKVLRQMDILVYDQIRTPKEICAEYKKIDGLQLVIVDGLSAFYGETGDDIRKNDRFLQAMKELAMRKNVLVVCTCDLCYDVHERSDSCPRIKDLPITSGGLNFADYLLLLYQKETDRNHNPDDEFAPELMECRIITNTKDHWKERRTLSLEWLPQFTVFRDHYQESR